MIYAGFWKRFLAFVIDGFIVFLISCVLIIPLYITPLSLILATLYKVIFETSPLRSTPGKSIMGLAVVRANGSTMTVKDSIVRFAVSFISSMFLFIGYLISLFNEKKQTFHDMVAGTVVIEETFAAPNYWSIFVNQWKILFSSAAQTYHESKTNTFETTARHVDPTPPTAAQSLEELYNLYKKGILTEEEYNTKKAEYLSRL